MKKFLENRSFTVGELEELCEKSQEFKEKLLRKLRQGVFENEKYEEKIANVKDLCSEEWNKRYVSNAGKHLDVYYL